MNPLVELKDVAFVYPGERQQVWRNLNLAIGAGETVLLLGSSGSGKSTLALCLCGLIPDAVEGRMSGTVRIAGIDTRRAEPGELAETVGIVFQDPDAQAVMMTAEDEVAFGLENMGVDAERMGERIGEALRTVGLAGYGPALIERLSGGQKQRLALAAVMAMKPAMLILDEPTANLDPAGTEAVFRTLREMKARGDRTLVLIEHKLDELADLPDRVVVIGETGELVLDGPPANVFYEGAETLASLGIWFPQTVELTRKLRALGLPLAGRPLSVRELAEALMRSDWPFPRKIPGDQSLAAPQAERSSLASPQSAQRAEALSPPTLPPLLEMRTAPAAAPGDSDQRPPSLQVRRGEFWVIVGENGAGKTTLARRMMGLLPSPPATVFIEGKDIAAYSSAQLAARIGYVFQNPEHQFVTERVADEIAFGLRGLGLTSRDVAERTEQLLQRFGLSAYAGMHPFKLSHGQKRRLSVAAMIALEQDLLILDEPTFGQDHRHTLELMGMLRQLQRDGRTIIAITHDMKLAAEYADHAALLSKGVVRQAGPIGRLFADGELLTAAGLRLPPAAELSRLLAALLPDRLTPDEISVDGWVRQWMRAAALRGKRGDAAMNGLYIPGQSALHRVNPLIKLIAVLPPVLFLTLVTDPWTSALFIAVHTAALVGMGRISWLQYARSSMPMLALACGIAAVYPLMAGETVTAGSTPVFAIGSFAVYEAGVMYGAATAMRLYAMFSVTMLFVMTTDPADFVRAMMQQWKLGSRFGYSTLAVLRFIPVLRGELAVVREAHKVRGTAGGGLRDRWAERMRRYMVPLLAAAVRRAERTSYAMDARGLGSRRTRTFYKTYACTAGDWLFLSVYWLLAAGMVAMLAYTGLLGPLSLLKLFG